MGAERKKYNFKAFDDAYRAAFYRKMAAHPVYATPTQKLVATMELQQCWLEAVAQVERRNGNISLMGAGAGVIGAILSKDQPNMVPFIASMAVVLGSGAFGAISMLRMAEFIRPQASVSNDSPDPDAMESKSVYHRASRRADLFLSDARKLAIATNG